MSLLAKKLLAMHERFAALHGEHQAVELDAREWANLVELARVEAKRPVLDDRLLPKEQRFDRVDKDTHSPRCLCPECHRRREAAAGLHPVEPSQLHPSPQRGPEGPPQAPQAARSGGGSLPPHTQMLPDGSRLYSGPPQHCTGCGSPRGQMHSERCGGPRYVNSGGGSR